MSNRFMPVLVCALVVDVYFDGSLMLCAGNRMTDVIAYQETRTPLGKVFNYLFSLCLCQFSLVELI
jgi:hypothetical protein